MSVFEDKYRRKVTGQEPEPEREKPAREAMNLLKDAAKDEYKAFNSSAHPELDLWVRVSDANGSADVALPYSYRNHMIYDGAGFVISMHYSTPVTSVTLHGRNMQDLYRKLLKREVEWLMEFDPKKWEVLPEDAACITGIVVKRSAMPERRYDDGGISSGEEPKEKEALH